LTSSKDKWIGAYFIDLTIPEKLGCPNKKKIIICVMASKVAKASIATVAINNKSRKPTERLK
jgi:hypothetical protein